ncbi:hypothetical protein CPC08DRAFT_669482 [Agrocybe pediades]|nr:hypothetical protein CPC08DRAFT_669482 [Agrocybe pediades]
MGGNAFRALLSSTAFPRLPPPVYKSIKGRFVPRLKASLYSFADVPREAPEKKDFGDLDILVATPKEAHSLGVTHEMVKSTLGAEFMIPMEGNRTSNYAVPVGLGEWAPLGYGAEEIEHRKATDDGKIYYQVDVHVCQDKSEWDRYFFFHAYGDFGMILGLIARNIGLHLGVKGLKMPDPPNPALHLSDSFDEITEFLGISLATFREGFKTKREVFEWAASVKYFDAKNFRSRGPGISKVKPERKMYAEFVEWVQKTKPLASVYADDGFDEKVQKVRRDALVFFQKKEEYENMAKAAAQARTVRALRKDSFSGHVVRDWTGLGEHWKGVKIIMDEVRARMGGDAAIVEFLRENSEDDLKTIVLQVQDDLGIKPRQQAATLSPTSRRAPDSEL